MLNDLQANNFIFVLALSTLAGGVGLALWLRIRARRAWKRSQERHERIEHHARERGAEG